MVDFEEALSIVALHVGAVRRPAAEIVALLDSRGRTLAEDLRADRDQPPFDRSTRDGFAVRASELIAGSLEVVGQVRAGEVWSGLLAKGSAISIMTGAPMPDGADAVVMIEHVVVAGKSVSLLGGRTLSAGENLVSRGSEARVDDLVLGLGALIGAAEVALAAACGHAELLVWQRPEIAIVATGDELVELDQALEPQQIRNSNSYAIAAMVAAAGGEARRLAIARDLREDVRARIVEGRRAKLLILSGGVSMGEYDLVEEILVEFGAEFFFTGVKMQPGKPVVFGRLPARDGSAECYFFGLPGNPISTQVTFHCFAEPFVRALCGAGEIAPRWAQATVSANISGKASMTRLLPARMEGIAVRVVAWQGSGDVAANARANCYAELLPGQDYVAGDVLRVLLR